MITVRVYQVGKWRWRVISGSDIVGDSSQGYVRRIDCVRMAQKRNPDAELVIDEPRESNDSQRP
jgi:hypothetical protein